MSSVIDDDAVQDSELLLEESPAEQPPVQEELSFDFDPVAEGRKIKDQTAVFELHVGSPGFTKKLPADNFVRPDSVDETATVQAADFMAKPKMDPKMLHVSQDIIDLKELKKISSLDSKFKEWVKNLAVPCPMLARGLYLVNLDDSKLIDTTAKSYITQRRELITSLGERYPQIIEDARAGRGGGFDPNDYPPFNEIEARYTVEKRFLSYNVPEALERINKEIYEQEAAKCETFFADAAKDIRDAYRIGMQNLVDDLLNKLGNDPETGKPKRFHPAAVTHMQEFIEKFDKRDMTNDTDLRALVNQAKELIAGVDPASVKKNEGLKDTIVAGFEKIKEQAANMVVVQERKIRFTEED